MVERFNLVAFEGRDDMWPDASGAWVRFSDYEALEAEIASLTARLEEAGKAGDALAAQTRSYSRGFSGTLELGKALNAWDAARRFAKGER